MNANYRPQAHKSQIQDAEATSYLQMPLIDEKYMEKAEERRKMKHPVPTLAIQNGVQWLSLLGVL